MRAFRSRLHCRLLVALAWLGVCLIASTTPAALANGPGPSIIPQLQERFDLSERQVKGALGALLVFARHRLPKPEFDQLTRSIPNAEYIMQEVKLQGIVTRPLDDLDEYEASLASLGIAQLLASQFAPVVMEYLGAAGFSLERDMLARILY